MELPELQALVRACLTDPALTYRQRVQALAGLAENALDPPHVSEACRAAQDKGVVHDLGEGNAPYRPRYVLPDYATALARGSEHLELPPPGDLPDALAFLLAVYAGVPSITGYPVYLGDLDTLLEPYAAGRADAALTGALRLFWRLLDRLLPDAFVHANLGPDDGRVVRALLAVDRELRQVVPNLTLRVDPGRTPDDLLREAVRTACADGKPHLVNHPLQATGYPTPYGVVSCYNVLPVGGGSHTLVRLNLAESVRRYGGGVEGYLRDALPEDVALTAELITARVRHLVERSPFFEHDWLVREGLVHLDRFTAMFGVLGVAEAVDTLLAHADPAAPAARYGVDPEADALGERLVARVAELVSATPVPYCGGSGGRAVLHAQSGIDSDVGVTAGARIPVGREPALYDHVRAVAPLHRWFTAGVSDVFRFEPGVARNPDAVVAVVRGAFAEGMRDVTFDVDGSGFVRVTGYLVRERDVAAAADGARHASTVLGATAIRNQALAQRVPKQVAP